MNRQWVLVMMLLAIAAAGLTPAFCEQQESAVRSAVGTFLQGLVNKNANLVQKAAHLPSLLVRSAATSSQGQVIVIKPEGLAEQLNNAPTIPGGPAMVSNIASKLAVTFLGDNVAVGIFHPRPRPGTSAGPGCTALVGKPPGANWKVVCLVVGPANGPIADQMQPVKQAVGDFWQALFANDVALMRRVVHLPYADVQNEPDGADIQIITAELLRQLESTIGELDEEDEDVLDADALMGQVQVRFFGQGAAVVLYASGFEGFDNKPTECAILARDPQGKWRIVAMGSD